MQQVRWLAQPWISSKRTCELEQNFWGPIILLESGVVNGLNTSRLWSCDCHDCHVSIMWTSFDSHVSIVSVMLASCEHHLTLMWALYVMCLLYHVTVMYCEYCHVSYIYHVTVMWLTSIICSIKLICSNHDIQLSYVQDHLQWRLCVEAALHCLMLVSTDYGNYWS